eukprot:6389685-Heterocapsa_arctica.AAC.1
MLCEESNGDSKDARRLFKNLQTHSNTVKNLQTPCAPVWGALNYLDYMSCFRAVVRCWDTPVRRSDASPGRIMSRTRARL